MDEKLLAKAHYRVDNSPALSDYSNIIFYDWNEGNEHLRWIITAPVAEIISWAKEILSNELDNMDEPQF